jgi:hypothetical protein
LFENMYLRVLVLPTIFDVDECSLGLEGGVGGYLGEKERVAGSWWESSRKWESDAQ